MALVRGDAANGIGAGANAALARVCLRASIAIIAWSSVWSGRLRAAAGGRIAGAGVVALIENGASDRAASRTGASLTGVNLGALITVVARRAVEQRWIGTQSRHRIADTQIVALIESGAHGGLGTGTGACLAGVCLRAEIAIVAGSAIGQCWIRAHPGRGIAGASIVAAVLRRAGHGVRAYACACLAGVYLGAEVAVIAGSAIGQCRIRAHPGRGIAGAGVVALIECRAREGAAAHADVAGTGIHERARVAIIARAPIREQWIGTDPG